jgi:hypothetical protein
MTQKKLNYFQSHHLIKAAVALAKQKKLKTEDKANCTNQSKNIKKIKN